VISQKIEICYYLKNSLVWILINRLHHTLREQQLIYIMASTTLSCVICTQDATNHSFIVERTNPSEKPYTLVLGFQPVCGDHICCEIEKTSVKREEYTLIINPKPPQQYLDGLTPESLKKLHEKYHF